jgi:tRNA A-37 threonylcarbamoyl transferase component Bud32/TPR repeat protein
MPESAEIKRIGRYDIARVLGEGAMGVVYEGMDTRLHRKVAIKRILKSALDSDAAKEYSMRFAREAQAVARLNHPNIVQVFDFAEEGEVAYIVMEFVKGKELKHFFEARERFELKEVVHIMGELCDALNFAHEAGIIHRDIKPANVMIDSQGRVKLTDFGVARITADSDRTVSDKTQAGTVVGTPAYMSPEQIQGEKLDRRTDIFSAGVILYEFLCGEKPFTGSGAWTIAKKILQDEPRKPSEINGTISPLFDAVVAKALAKSADTRYQNAREFGLSLKRALEGLPPEIDESERTVKLSAMTKEQLGIAPAPKGDATVLRTVPMGQPGQPAMQSAPGTAPKEVELEFWRSIKDGSDPDDFDLYVEQFPNGIYAALAKRRSAKLRGVAPAEDSKTPDQERREIEEAARLEKEARAKLAEEKAALEARLAQREADMAKREAELKETMAREAELKKQVAEAPKRSAIVPVLVTLAIAAIVGGLWYWLKPPDPLQQRVAELTQLLEESKKREAELIESRQRQAELEKELVAAREREAEALKAGDVAKQRELAEQVRQSEAAARQQAELTRQREAEARRQAEVAEQRRAEIARLQGKKGPVLAKATEPAAPAEPVKAVEPAKAAPEPAKAVEPKAETKASEPIKMAAVTPTPTPTPSTPSPAVPEGASIDQMLQRAIALEGEGKNAEAVRLLRQVTRSGKGPAVGQAAKRLGDIYQKKGVPGVSYDYAEALKFYQIARDNGVDPGVAKGR